MSNFWLVCDNSGSMLEAGKRLAVRGLLREAEQYVRLGYGRAGTLKVVAWGAEAKQIPWSPGDEAPAELLACAGSADGRSLISLLAADPDGRFVFFTDGFWDDESRAEIRRWKQSLGRDALRVIKVGADANPRLKGSDVFDAEDFLAAMDGWLS